MTIQHWRIFVTVCECGSITAAGNKLFLAQSAVSRAIMEIESFYNIQLFDRVNRRIQITPAGTAILGYAKNILDDYTLMENFIRGLETHLILRIGTSASFAKFVFPEALRVFEQQYPFIETRLSVDLSSTLEKKISMGELDIAFTERTPRTTPLQVDKMPGDKLCFFCAPDHPLASKNNLVFSDLLDYSFCLKNQGHSSRDIFDAFCVLNGYQVKCDFESIVGTVLTEMVTKSDRIGVLAFWQLKSIELIDSIKILNVTDADLKRYYYVLTREGINLSRMKENKLIDLVRDVASRNYTQMETYLNKF